MMESISSRSRAGVQAGSGACARLPEARGVEMIVCMPRKSSRPARALIVHESTPAAVVPIGERRLSFGGKWTYAPAPESAPVKIAPRYELFIGGKFVAPKSGEYFPSINPATEKKLAEIAAANAADVDAAVSAARRAFKSWSRLPGRERGKYLYRIARILQEKARELAVLETMDGGKPIKESRDFDVPIDRKSACRERV